MMLGSFLDRADGGKQLAEKLVEYIKGDVLVLGIPRGGVPVAYEVATRLHAPLDTLPVRKIGAPMNPEFGLGAIAPGDVRVFDDTAIHALGFTRHHLEPIIDREMREMNRRMAQYRSGEYTRQMIADTVIIIDDGLATGISAQAAFDSAQILQKPKTIIIAAPICAPRSARMLRERGATVVCVVETHDVHAIGQWYRNFEQTTDAEVIACLEKAAYRSAPRM